MRKPHLLLLSALFLAACGGSTAEVACTLQYWDGVIGTCMPAGWHALSPEQLKARGVPPEVSTGFEREQPIAGQNPIIIVLRETLGANVATADYSTASINAVKALPSYEEIDQRALTVDEDETTMHVYSAQPLPEQPKGRFYQVSAVHEGAGYTLTAALPLSPDGTLEDEVELVLSNLTFTQQSE